MSFSYTVRRSKRRTLSLRVSPEAEIFVYAPLRATDEDVEAFIRRHEEWLKKALSRVNARIEKYPEPTKEELMLLKKEARRVIPPLVNHYAALLGVTPTSIRINAARTRHGSCNAKGGLNFSCRVMRFPMEAVEYVVVHELAHIREMNHSKAFYAVVEGVLPDYKRRRAFLKE